MEQRGTVSAGNYNFFYGKYNEKLSIGKKIFVHHRTVSGLTILEFVSDSISYIVLRGYRCNIIILNMHATSEE